MDILFWCLLPQLIIITPFLLREPAFRGWVARKAEGRINWLYKMNEDFVGIHWRQFKDSDEDKSDSDPLTGTTYGDLL